MDTHKNWIKNLAQQEDRMESTGVVHFQSPDPIQGTQEELKEHSIEFLKQLRVAFTQNVSVFNQIKSYVGTIRIYGINDTPADFMLFRNGYKLVFSMKTPGSICIRFLNIDSLVPNDKKDSSSPMIDYLDGVWGPFGELKWAHKNRPLQIDFLIRYYMTLFVKNSIR